MRYLFFKDFKRCKKYNKYEIKRNLVKCLFFSKQVCLPLSIQDYYFFKLKFLRKTAKSRIKNRCVESNKSQGVLSFFRVGRIVFREKASFGLFSGLRKAIW